MISVLASRPAARSATVGEAIVGLLEAHGVTTVFGIPGVHTIELYRGLAGSDIRHVTPRHEQGAGFMADGYTRVRGDGPGVCFVISGAGVTNVLSPIAQAYHDSQPLLVISAEPSRDDRGHGSLHELPDQLAITRSICAFSATVTEPERLPDLLHDAYEVFTAARPRPVHISVPTDVLAAPAPSQEARLPSARRPRPTGEQIQAAADVLARAQRPFLILGGGGVDAADDAAALAELVGAPIITTGNAKGAIGDSHPLSLGCALASEAVLTELRAADAVVAVGTELSSVEALVIEGAIDVGGKVVRIDIDPLQLLDDRYETVGVLADAKLALSALNEALRGREINREGRSERAQSLRTRIRWWPQVTEHQPWLDAIAAAMPPDAVVALDSTQLAYSALNCLRRAVAAPRSSLAPYGFGTLGPALPMALGAKVAAPNRSVLAIAGDGGALFTIAELATAATLSLGVTLIVWDGQSYQEIADSMARVAMPPIGTDLNAVDFVALGHSFGCDAERVGDPDGLHDALQRAQLSGRPTVLHVSAA